MEELLPFLEKNEVWIYFLLGAVAFVYFQKLIKAWQDWQGTVFGLERDSAQRRFSTSLTILTLLILFVVVEFVIVSFVAPNNPQLAALPTPTLNILATPTVTLPAIVGAVEEVDGAAPTSFASNGTPAADSAIAGAASTPGAEISLAQEGCVPGQIEWTYPAPGESLTGTIELKGTVNVPNLGYYKYEFSRPGEDLWFPIAVGNQPKIDGQIGFWNTSLLDQGDYFLRLVVEDNAQNLFPACKIPVRLANP